VPFGPANPSVLSDPSGIGNASRIPPPGKNSPPPPLVYGPISSSPSRVAAPYAGASQRVFSAHQVRSRRPPVHRRGRSTAAASLRGFAGAVSAVDQPEGLKSSEIRHTRFRPCSRQ
jgi:hypothetical protein